MEQKRKSPSEIRQGMVVGAFVGFLYGIVAALQFYFTMLPFILPLITRQLLSDPNIANNPEYVAGMPGFLSLLNTMMYCAVVLIIPIEAVFGCMLGLLFVKCRNHIPCNSVIGKSVAFSIILVAISLVFGLPSFFNPKASTVFGANFFPLQIQSYIVNIVTFPLLGLLFGYLLNRRLKSQ
jgi:hypothetical protein